MRLQCLHVACARAMKYPRLRILLSGIAPSKGKLHPQPLRRRGALQITAKVGQLFYLGSQYGGFHHMLVGNTAGAARAANRKGALAIPTPRDLPPHNFTLADEARGKLRGTAVLAARTA